MSIDISWLWNALNGVASMISTWFSSLWTTVTEIANTGQGLFMGLTSLGTQIWGAIQKGADVFGEWIHSAFEWIYDGIKYWADIFGEWFSNAMGWIGSGLNYIAMQIYNFGAWIWSGASFVANWVVNAAIGVWGAVMTFFSSIATSMMNWWASFTTTVNQWFTNLIVGVRNKIITTIQVDVSLQFGWKAAERIINPQKISDIGYGMFGMVVAPITGYLFGTLINSMIPTPSTTPFKLIPDTVPFTFTPPSLTITTPSGFIPPMGNIPTGNIPAPPTPTIQAGLPLDVGVTMTISHDETWVTTDASPAMNVSHDETTDSETVELTMDIAIETVIT